MDAPISTNRREPIGEAHGVQLFSLANLIEATGQFAYDYEMKRRRFMGEFIDVHCVRTP